MNRDCMISLFIPYFLSINRVRHTLNEEIQENKNEEEKKNIQEILKVIFLFFFLEIKIF